MLSSFFKNRLKDFNYFYSLVGNRIFVLVFLSVVVSFLDGIGLAMFLPLLQFSSETTKPDPDEMGNIAVLLNYLEKMGIPLELNTVLVFIILMFLFKGAARYVYGKYNVTVQQFFMRKIRVSSIRLLAGVSFGSFVYMDSGRIVNTLNAEVQRVNSAYIFFFTVMQNSIFVIVYLVLAVVANPQFALLVIAGGLVINFLLTFLYSRTKKLSSKVTKSSHIYQGELTEFVSFFKYLKATNGLEKFLQRVEATVRNIENDNRKIGLIQAFMLAVKEPLVVIVVIGIIFIQVTFFSKAIGLIMVSLLFFYRALEALIAMQLNWSRYLGFSGAMKNTYQFIDELKQNQGKTDGLKVGSLKNELLMKGVSFKYRETVVLRGIDINIKKNTTVAFVGESGSGKTTLINILAGLLKPTEGSYYIDGIDSRQVSLPDFQKRIGYITQEPIVFNDTIYNNVTFWAEKNAGNMVRFYDALEKASLIDFVNKLPDREDTILGSNGILISGGQKQRISIARELFKEIDVLIMDEATSALDSETEQAIQENINSLRGKYTIIIIAHRLSTIKNVDKIFYLKGGTIEDSGNFEELIFKNPDFERMVLLQKLA